MEIADFQWMVYNPRIGPSVKRCYLGRVVVGTVTWNVSSSTEHYVGTCLLPNPKGDKESHPSFDQENEAFKWVEAAVKNWFAAVTK